ncbi:MAG TPA: hypothetical protein VH595_07730 [Verrucomicrobiae bacterium]|jgi:hypothetical protein|nr:hypothetical protein [Verrucomicrobiae bacterium]
MSVTRSTLTGGPAYAVFNSKNIQFTGDSRVDAPMVWEDIDTALYGKIDKIARDLVVKAKGRPRFYDTAALSTMFPYLAGVSGTLYPGSSDVSCAWNSNNGDTITITSAIVGKMPELELSVNGPVLGEMEIWGVIGNGMDPSNSTAYFSKSTGNSFSNPAVPGTAVIGNQEFTASWGSIGGFTSFQAQEKWTISHELELQPVEIQGRTRALRFVSYRAMAKCKPLGPTMAQIDAALYAQGSGAAGGYRLSTNAANLVISGSNSMTITVGNAGMVTEGFVFGGKALRQGELGWVSSLNVAGGGIPGQAALTLA